MPLTGFELRTSGGGSNLSTNWAPIITLELINFGKVETQKGEILKQVNLNRKLRVGVKQSCVFITHLAFPLYSRTSILRTTLLLNEGVCYSFCIISCSVVTLLEFCILPLSNVRLGFILVFNPAYIGLNTRYNWQVSRTKKVKRLLPIIDPNVGMWKGDVELYRIQLFSR